MNERNITAGLYIHTPFCLTKCMYCDFYSVVGQDNLTDRFIKALAKEIQTYENDHPSWSFNTLFIGGGTPSLLSPREIEDILDALHNTFDLSGLTEITLEANPGEAPLDKLQGFRTLGINRISVGVQSFIERDLSFLGRIHSGNDIIKTVKVIEKAGFDNFSFDLIHGIPGQSLEDWRSNLKKAVEFEPVHISAYNLTVEEKTTLYNLVESGKVTLNTDELQASMISYTEEFLKDYDFQQYEISNFSKRGKECAHNIQYWSGNPYISFGPSAASYDGNRRWKNRSSLEYYISSIETGRSPSDFSENLTSNERINERLGFGIRMNKGIDLASFEEPTQEVVKTNIKSVLEKWEGFLLLEDNNLRLSSKGRLFADAIAVDIMI